jgi:hypothetical protein
MDLLLDFDSAVYACGFAAQKKQADGTIEAAPASHAIVNIRQLYDNIEFSMTQKIRASGDKSPIQTKVFLTGKDNYRNKIATIRPYKGNRDKLAKPVHYEALRGYLVKMYGAQIIDGREADDAVASLQYQADYETTCICSIDKDLTTVPGLNYNFKRKELRHISLEESRRAFWKQVLTGDVVDNIAGCYQIGAKKAAKILDPIKWDRDFEDKAWAACVSEYELSIYSWGDVYKGLSGSKALLENARLLHMQEFPGQLWTPPGAKEEWLPGYGP